MPSLAAISRSVPESPRNVYLKELTACIPSQSLLNEWYVLHFKSLQKKREKRSLLDLILQLPLKLRLHDGNVLIAHCEVENRA